MNSPKKYLDELRRYFESCEVTKDFSAISHLDNTLLYHIEIVIVAIAGVVIVIVVQIRADRF